MGVRVQWDNEEKTILRQIYEGDVILDDYYIAINEVITMAKSVPHTVHSIMDRTKVRKTSGAVLRAMRYANDKLPGNMGMRVIVRANMLTKMMVDMGKKFAPKLVDGVAYCETVEEAHQLIQQYEAQR